MTGENTENHPGAGQGFSVFQDQDSAALANKNDEAIGRFRQALETVLTRS